MRNLLVLGLLLFSAVNAYSMATMPIGIEQNALIGKQAPELTLPRVVGEPSNFTQVREGKKTIIVFWASWCPHCVDEIAHLNRIKVEFISKGIQVLFVNEGETKKEVVTFINRRQYEMNSFLDEENALQDLYYLVGLPTIVFIDEAGIIRTIMNEFPKNYDEKFK